MKYIALLFFCFVVNLYAQFGGEFDNEHGSGFDEAMVAEFEDEFDQEKDFDPLEGYNRVMTIINDKIYIYALNPLTKGYKEVTPQEFRDRVHDLFENLLYPVRVVNNILQLKIDGAVVETGRFMFNSTFGIGGLFDAASAQGIKKYDEDFGQTLGHYGLGSGFYIVVPLYGPSNLRDLSASFVDGMISPLNYSNTINYALPNSNKESCYLHGFRTINTYSYNVDTYEFGKRNSIDFYLFMKDMYESKREKMIRK